MSDTGSLRDAREKTRSMCRSSSAMRGSKPEPSFIGELWALLQCTDIDARQFLILSHDMQQQMISYDETSLLL